MTHFLKQFGFILLTFVGLSTLISFGCLWQLRQSSFYKPSFLVNSVKEDTFDYIILGASTGLTGLNTKVTDSILGIKGINLSMDDTSISTQYLMLQHFLAEGKSTKFCIIAPNNTSYNLKKDKLSANDYRFLPFVNREYVYNYYSQYENQEAQLLKYSKWIPILGVSYYNAELFYPSVISLKIPNERNRFDERGNFTYPILKKNSIKIDKQDTLHIQFSNYYLKEIKKLCETHNIQLICYISPMANKYVEINTNEYQTINHGNLMTSSIYYFDKIHVNSLGRNELSNAFSIEFMAIKTKHYINE